MKSFFQGFEPVPTPKWVKAVEKVLKEQSIEQLNWEIEPGISLSPYPKEVQPLPIWIDRAQNQWTIVQGILVEDEAAANALALEALQGGAEGLVFDLVKPQLDLARLLKGIYVEMLYLHFKGQAAPSVLAQWQALGLPPAAKLSIEGLSQASAIACSWIHLQAEGQHPSDRLASLLTQAWPWLRDAQKWGLSPEDLTQAISLHWICDPRYLVDLAALRALRHLWTKLLEAANAQTPSLPWIAAYTQNIAADKPYRNMLVGCTQAMSASLAGAHSLCVQPAKTEEGSFFPRMARNVQHLLKLESFFDRVLDPTAGAYSVETLTQLLIQRSWAKFIDHI